MPTKLINLKKELEEYGRKLRFLRHFRNNEMRFSQERFKPKSTFDAKNKDAVIETYLSCLEQRFQIPSKRFNNLTKDGHKSLSNESLFSQNYALIKMT